jgi:rhodanese-related sulfurtransferase
MAPAFAIPSPELVVGSLSSISQLVALVSALLGGGAAVMGLRARSKGGLSRGMVWSVVGLFVVLAGALSVLVYLYMDLRAERTARLEATLTRPMPNIGGRSLDPMLKEVGYGDQQKHPRGIHTDELEKLLEAKARGERQDTILVDIRETAETEMGGLPGSRTVRFPDLATSKLDFTGKTAILYCHNGNRGYETCMAMAERGINCRFMVGGLEKWLVEKRPLTGLQARTLDDLRALAPYRNQTVLLDTPEVRKLVEDEGAIFVDVRYPGEFASSHLPGAINVPIRPTPTEQLNERLRQIPKKPVIAPCYDRRSCFFAEVLGLELTRAGYDYRGKYTVPWDYFIPSTPRPYIAQWRAEAAKSWWTKGSEALAALLLAIGKYVGFIGAVVLLALVSRLLVLPFSLKAERDQIRSRAVAADLKELKVRLKHDPRRLARAMQAFYRRNGFTPLRNLVGLLFLPVMAISVTAVHEAATKTPGGFLWMPDLADRDPWLVLPILFAVLIALYVDLAFARTNKQRALIWLISLPVLTG